MSGALESTVRDYREGDAGDEDDISGQLIGRMKERVETLDSGLAQWSSTSITSDDGPASPSIRLRARHLHWRGDRSEEALYGADIVLVLDVDLPTRKFTKGMLIQAKKLEPGKSLKAAEERRLVKQCGDMLDLTPAAYILGYGRSQAFFDSAAAVEAKRTFDAADSPYSNEVFFYDFFICWIGDPRLNATTKEQLAILRAQTNARTALAIHANAPKPKHGRLLDLRRRILDGDDNGNL